MNTFFKLCFCFVFTFGFAFHYSHMKSPSQNREVANFHAPVKPWYDASWKL